MDRTIAEIERLGVSVQEAAKIIGVSRSLMYELIGNGEVESYQIATRRLVIVDSLKRLIGRQRVVTRVSENLILDEDEEQEKVTISIVKRGKARLAELRVERAGDVQKLEFAPEHLGPLAREFRKPTPIDLAWTAGVHLQRHDPEPYGQPRALPIRLAGSRGAPDHSQLNVSLVDVDGDVAIEFALLDDCDESAVYLSPRHLVAWRYDSMNWIFRAQEAGIDTIPDIPW